MENIPESRNCIHDYSNQHVSMTGCGIMPVIGVIQFDGAVFDSARNGDENRADKN